MYTHFCWYVNLNYKNCQPQVLELPDTNLTIASLEKETKIGFLEK